jgi:hypothetical protein
MLTQILKVNNIHLEWVLSGFGLVCLSLRDMIGFQINGGVEVGFTDATAGWVRAAERAVFSDIATDILPGVLSLSTRYGTADYAHTNPSHGDRRRHDIIRQITIKHRIGLTEWSVPKPNEPSLTVSIGAMNQTSNIENYSRNSGEISLVLTRYF